MSNSKLETLSEIFNDKQFRIPDYQRGYSWVEEQLQDFWRDISNLNDNRIHYTGMITVEHKIETDYYHIIDGQQRLTTTIILLNEVLKKFDNNDWVSEDKQKTDFIKQYLYKTNRTGYNKVPIFGYEKDNPSDVFFRKSILELESTDSHNIQANTLYTKNLQFAKKFFAKKIDSLKIDSLEKLINKIVKQLKFNFYEIDSNEGLDEYIIFETMNNRGKQLTTLELLKNRLIYLTTLLKTDKEDIQELRNDINEVWKTIYEFLGKKSNEKIEDDKFLKDHWIMYFGKYDRKVANPEKDFLLKKYFTVQKVTLPYQDDFEQIKELAPDNKIKKHILTYNDIKDYIFDLQESVVAYYNLHNPLNTNYSEEVKQWLSKINRLGFDTFKPLLIALFINKSKIENEKIIKILKFIENYMFIKFKTMKGSKSTIYDFFNMAFDYHSNNDIYKLIEKLDSTIFYDNHRNKLFKVNSFITLIQELQEDEKKKGWYDWGGLSYLLYEYELKLQSDIKGETKLAWEEINKESIEHIYPQNTIRECWENINKLDKSLQERLAHSLGNLVLLSKSYNSKLGNKCFDDKNIIYSTASYSTIEISKNTKWGSEEIIKRGEKILRFMKNRWNIDIPTEYNEKIL